MKHFLFNLVVLLAYLSLAQAPLLAQPQIESEKYLIKSFKLDKAEAVVISFPAAEIETRAWKNNYLRLELEIHANVPNSILENLVQKGRYFTVGRKDGDDFIIEAPNLEEAITIGDMQLEERIRVLARTPGEFEVDGQRLIKRVDPSLISKNSRRQKRSKRIEQDKLEIKIVLRGSDSDCPCPYEWKQCLKSSDTGK